MIEHPLGSDIGNFRITGLIGAGAMGTVYRGVHRAVGHQVAIKTLRAPATGVERARQLSKRFVAEARLLAQLRGCPNVISVYDFGQLPGGQLYYVMELLEGHDLEQLLRSQGPLETEQAAIYLQQICNGLECAHRQRIVHRDLKPANIFVCPAALPRVVLLDFGIALNLRSHAIPTLGVVGSPIYAAPEQISKDRGLPVGPWTDIYTLGVLSYQLLGGELPFDVPVDATPYDMLMLPVQHTPVPLAARAPWLPAGLCALIDSCLAYDPRQRPQTAKAFFESYLATTSQAGPGERRRRSSGLCLTPLSPTICENTEKTPEKTATPHPHPAHASWSWSGSFHHLSEGAHRFRGTTRLSVAAMLCALLLGGADSASGPTVAGAHASAEPDPVVCATPSERLPSRQVALRVDVPRGTPCETVVEGEHFDVVPATVRARMGRAGLVVVACRGFRLTSGTIDPKMDTLILAPERLGPVATGKGGQHGPTTGSRRDN